MRKPKYKQHKSFVWSHYSSKPQKQQQQQRQQRQQRNRRKWNMSQFTSAGIILKHNSRLLLVQGSVSIKWGFPKGHVEPGETLFDTACRELLEETGYKLRNRSRPYYCWISHHKSCKIYFILQHTDINVNKTRRVINTQEILQTRWFVPEALRNLGRIEVNIDLWTYKQNINKGCFLPAKELIHYKPKLCDLRKAILLSETFDETKTASKYSWLSQKSSDQLTEANPVVDPHPPVNENQLKVDPNNHDHETSIISNDPQHDEEQLNTDFGQIRITLDKP